jgi:hypothetical protein
MDGRARDFLSGFQRAAWLAEQVRSCPSSYASREDYLRDVARLHAGVEDLARRGLAVGCLAALGEE